jgi:hydroxymethylpyrimidine/phosphomethylpyrimidine kinase
MEIVTPVLLSVGTTHPLNIAGVGLDVRIAPLLGVRVVTIVAGVSAQNAVAVLERMPVAATVITAQFEALRDVAVDAIHVGALLDAESVRAVARGLADRPGIPAVCDPVLAATGGDRLADDATAAALRDELAGLCALLTPNLAEAGLLTGRPLTDVEQMEAAARELRALGVPAVLVKGGHLAGEPVDVLAGPDGVTRFTAKRIPGWVRGTGDLLAAAAAARFAYGDGLAASITAARAFVRGCIAAAVPFAGTRTVP